MLDRKEDDGWEQDLDEMEEAALDAAETAIEEMCNGIKCENVQDSNLLQIRVWISIIINHQGKNY